MTKAKYLVYGENFWVTNTFVTTTRNSEDMIMQLKERFDPVRIVRVIEGVSEKVYTRRDKRFWEGKKRWPKRIKK
jgi:hypothetical protein